MSFRVPRRISGLAVGLLLSAAAFAQTKVAIIDMREAVNGTAEVKKAVAALEAKFKPRQAEAEKISRDLQEIRSKLESLQGKLTPQGEQDLVTQGQRKERDLRRIQEDLEADVNREQQEVGGRALQRMRDVVKKLAESKQLDVVVDVSQTVYAKPALDITKEAVAAYDVANPAK
ncbi:MAG: OmpH family outer membrane protein [Bryobacteraceae bacterium]|nr:OmpH family outer membrane protein [Bryobacteraceae bacterium]